MTPDHGTDVTDDEQHTPDHDGHLLLVCVMYTDVITKCL